MFEGNCKFVKTKNIGENINIINFVYEKDAKFKQEYIFLASHCVYFLTEGIGVFTQ